MKTFSGMKSKFSSYWTSGIGAGGGTASNVILCSAKSKNVPNPITSNPMIS